MRLAEVDGVRLLSVGSPTVDEFAAWRYGERLRPPRWARYVPGTLEAGLGLVVGGVFGFYGISGVAALLGARYGLIRLRDAAQPIARVMRDDGSTFLLTVRRARASELIRRNNGHWELAVLDSHDRLTFLTGASAALTLSQMLPALRTRWATSNEVLAATRLIVEHRDTVASFAGSASVTARRVKSPAQRFEIRAMPTVYLLAVEMLANDERERCALDGDLEELSQAWRDAEDVAAIADSLTLPAAVRGHWHELLQSRQRE